MAKFCSECGFKLSGSEKFCGSCGAAVLSLCPTCGQEWSGVPTAPSIEKKIKPEVTATIRDTGSNVQTSARVQPIYGPAYEDGKDCPNCGAKSMGNKTCKTCESEN